MSFAPNVPIDVLVCYGKERGTRYPHWMLMLISQGAQRGTWYHAVGGPTQHAPYSLAVQADKRLDSHGIETTELIGSIMPKDVNKFKSAAQRVKPQQCQRFVVAVVHELEKKELINRGEAVRLNGKVQMSELAQAYAVQNPVEHPSGAYVPAAPSIAGPSTSGRRTSPQRTQQSQQGPPATQQAKRPKQSKGCCIVM
ncbi:Hypothetical predicted protein [Lecanosticta acicola]|uniref:Uncharacterized protein n=1 Tax=Lecanosticta acicola TaxID=111012 RepID=A0AAI9E3M5_9PEZI|nr:Hypothetical predicted protein [Lecanosticta acicola]